MRISAAIITASIATAGIALVATPAVADSAKSPVFINPWEASGFCLTADPSATSTGTVSVLPCTDTPTQRWHLNPAGQSTVTIENAASHLVIERAGTKLQQSKPVAGNPNQVWRLNGNKISDATLNGQSQQWTVVSA